MGLERVSLIWIACPSRRQLHLCSTYQDGKVCAAVRALELPRVARDSTHSTTGRQGVYPEAEATTISDKFGQAVPSKLVKKTKRDRFQVKMDANGHDKGNGVVLCRDRTVLVIAGRWSRLVESFKLEQKGHEGSDVA